MPSTAPPTDLEYNGETCAITRELNYEQRRQRKRSKEKPDRWGECWRKGNSLGPFHSAMGLLINRVNLNNAPELLSSLGKLRWLIESFKIHPDRHYRWQLEIAEEKSFPIKNSISTLIRWNRLKCSWQKFFSRTLTSPADGARWKCRNRCERVHTTRKIWK